MKSFNIALDSDGVLYDFKQSVIDHFGNHPNKLVWDNGDKVIKGGDAMWRHIETVPNFVRDLPLFPGADVFVDWLIDNFNSVYVVTGVPSYRYDVIAEQKHQKYKAWRPDLEVITCLARDKPLHMRERTILIDDMFHNIKRWEAAGGASVHHKDFESTINALKEIFE